MNEFREKQQQQQTTETDNNNNNSNNSKKRETIFLDILMEKYFTEPGSISPENMRSEVNTFILGGHDTTANATIFSLLLIGQHPEVGRKILEELEEAGLLLQNSQSLPIEIEALKRLRYLEATIKETLRLYPSVQAIARRLVEELTLPDGKRIPAGSTVYVPILSLHLDASVFPDPNSFIPERFLPSSSHSEGTSIAAKNPYAFIPFSAGARSCIG